MRAAPRPRGWSRRGLMYLLVGLQVLILGAIVASQEVNRFLDSSPAVDLEIPEAHVRKDPFRGAFLSGQPAMDLTGTGVELPPGGLAPGERVLVFFRVEPGKRPSVFAVQRREWGREPAFEANQFSIPGRVRRTDESGSSFRRGGGWVAAQRFEDQPGGVFRYESDGRIPRLPASVSPRATGDWNRGRLGPDGARASGPGRLYVQESQAIAILGPVGALLKRLEGFRYARLQSVRP